MKKIIALLLAGMLAATMVACDKEETKEKVDDAADKVESVADSVADAVEEAVATEAVVTEAPETEAPKPRDKYNYVDLYEAADGGHTPISLMAEGSSAAVHVKFDEGFIESWGAQCPSWSDNVGNLTFRVYKWDTDYATSVAGAPLAEQTFEDYGDNDDLLMDEIPAKTIGAGEYLLWIGEGVDEGGSGVGYWGQNIVDDAAVVEYYRDGAVVEGQVAFEGTLTIIVPAE